MSLEACTYCSSVRCGVMCAELTNEGRHVVVTQSKGRRQGGGEVGVVEKGEYCGGR